MSPPSSNQARLDRARLSLEGLSVGDAFGELFFVLHEDFADAIERRSFPPAPWRYTDDTQTALALVRELAGSGEVDPDALFTRMSTGFDPMRGYGPGATRLLRAGRAGADWREASRTLFPGGGSFGNGAAMRSPPLGAYFADDPVRAIAEAARSAEVTHAHREGVAGAVAVVAAAAFVAGSAGRDFDSEAYFDAIEAALAPLPGQLVAEGVRVARGTKRREGVTLAAARLGNGSGVTAPDTVPFCLWVVARHPDSYEEALWSTVRALGDRDTNCAIVGGILAPRVGLEGIPPSWRANREPLPA